MFHNIQIQSDAIFIADAHYNHNRQELFELLSHTRSSQIFLMGDIFDFLCGEIDYFIKQNYELITLIKHLSLSRQIIYLEGNHDFLLNDIFDKVIVIPRKQQPLIVTFEDNKVALSHGDIFTPISYNIYTSIIRNKYFLKFLNMIDFNNIISIYVNEWLKQKDICHDIDDFESFAINRISLYKNYNVDMIIEGHFHQGKRYKNYFNIPSYTCTNKTYARINDKSIQWECDDG